MRCINSTCGQQITISDAAGWLPAALRGQYIEKMDAILLRRGVVTRDDGRREVVHWCANARCGSFHIGDGRRREFSECVECGERTCVQCGRQWAEGHGAVCEALDDVVHSVNAGGGELVKRCPTCGMAVQKRGGCDHMTCRRAAGGCGAEFCWECLADYKGDFGIHSMGHAAHQPYCSHYL